MMSPMDQLDTSPDPEIPDRAAVGLDAGAGRKS
jgi:hypothetical protein